MTVMLVLLFIITCLSIDAIKQYKIRHANDALNEVLYHPSIGLTMADGGEKIEEKKT